MPILVVGVNYRSCPIEIRERLAFRPEQLPAAYAALRDQLGLAESLILSTCNRVEIYAQVPVLDGTVHRVTAFLSAHSDLELERLRPQLYTHTEPSSIEHLFRVASGLDSMVLGETDILYQVRASYELAQRYGTTGKALNTLFQRALNAGKSVQSRTGVGRGCLSVGTVAIELAQKIFGDLRPYTVLLVGAGKIGELVLQRLTDRGVARVVVMNRSADRAHELARAYGGVPAGLAELSAWLVDADIAITSASAPSTLIGRPLLGELMAWRRNRPLCLIDLGVPRNIDPDAGRLENVYLFDVDDLQGLVAHHQAQRQQAVDASRTILAQKLRHFFAWRQRALDQSDPEPLAGVDESSGDVLTEAHG